VERTVSGATYDYVFDNQGKENTQGSAGFAGWNWSELYLGGMHVNTYADGSTYFSHADHLGSERTETDPTGNTNSSAQTNLPFGEWTSTGFQSGLGFTGDLHDDGGVFHTPNRQLSQTQGRWLTPDPAGLAAVNPLNPQTWNRYAYVGNNPVTYNDPSGLKRDLGWAPGGGAGFTGLYMQTGGSAYNTWAANFTNHLIASGFGYVSSWGVRQDPDTGQLEQIVGWQTRTSMDLFDPDNNVTKEVPIWGDYTAPDLMASNTGAPGSSCIWGMQTVCGWMFNRGWLKNNKQADRQIFNMTNDPEKWAFGGPIGTISSQINQLAGINLAIDTVALGEVGINVLDHVPGLDLPPGITDAADAGIDYFLGVRNQNNTQIDQLLQSVGP